MSSNGTLAPSSGQAVDQTLMPRSASTSLLARMGERFGVDPDKMLNTLKATAFRVKGKGDKPAVEITNEQIMALLIVADQYHLNPWTKEIYAFPQDGGIVPIVGVDGWIRMMNENPQFDGIEFLDGPEVGEKPRLVNEWIECSIYRKDRQHPIKVREYIVECRKDTGPWGSHPRRMLRHKALIQAARIAFGFAGIYDEDEAEGIIDANTRNAPAALAAPPQGRVHHNRIANALPPATRVVTPMPEAGTVEFAEQVGFHNGQNTPKEPAFDEDAEIRRQELIASLNEQLNSDLSGKALNDVFTSLCKNEAVLGPDIHADMTRRYRAKCEPGGQAAAAGPRRF